MKTWTLRRRLTLWSALVTAIALLTFGVAATFSLYFEQLESIDHVLGSDADVFFSEYNKLGSALWENGEEANRLLKANGRLTGFALGEKAEVAKLHGYPIGFAAQFETGLPSDRNSTAWIDGRHVRLGVFKKQGQVLVLGTSIEPARHLVSELLGAYFIALPLVLIVVAVGSWWIAGRALKPISAITAAAASITADRLDARLPALRVQDEIGKHIDVINAMFDRLQASFEQANRFTADASHELRTPLTILRGEIEAALNSGSFNAAQENVLVGLLDQTSGLQKITENLLLLARFDAGKGALATARVNFSLLVQDAVEDAELLAAPQRITVKPEVATDVRISGDEVFLRRVLLNLVDNAVRYNREEGIVAIRLERSASFALFSVSNSGSVIPPDKRGELFKRFFRINDDRNRSTGGSGLGLSLCREIVLAHGGQLELIRSDESGTEFQVRFPLV